MVFHHTLSVPASNLAALVIVERYEKRALHTRESLTLANSLQNLLQILINCWTPTILQISRDGGLELLVRIASRLCRESNTHRKFKKDLTLLHNNSGLSSTDADNRHNASHKNSWDRDISLEHDFKNLLAQSAALECISHISVKGDFHIRIRILNAGILECVLPLYTSACLAFKKNQSNISDQDQIDDPNFPPVIWLNLIAATKMVAFISKCPETLVTLTKSNLYCLIEQFTGANVATELQKWAIICIRNSFKHAGEGTRGKSRCAYFRCERTGVSRREFTKCKICKRVVYCSQNCQIASLELHRNWCASHISQLMQ